MIWLSRRATVVLPVPGLPLNTRWWLVSTVGIARSSEGFWMQQAGQPADIRLHRLQSNELVELGKQVLDRPGGGMSARLGGGVAQDAGVAAARPQAADGDGRAGCPGRATRAASTAAGGWCVRSIAAISSGDGTRSTGGGMRGGCRARSSGAPPGSRASALSRRSKSTLGSSSHAACHWSIAFEELGGATSSGSSRGPMMSDGAELGAEPVSSSGMASHRCHGGR